MHGRPRQKGPSDPNKVAAAAKKAELYGQLSKEVLGRRRAGAHDAASLELSARLLELNPEVYTVWNHRREAIQAELDAGGESAVAAAGRELALTQRALQRNPKSYAAWHHRRWVVGRRLSSLERELELVGQLLEVDERNFHAWGYRRFIVGLMGTPCERELEYSLQKINQNFSNYSAWHYRTTLLPGSSGTEGGAHPAVAAEPDPLGGGAGPAGGHHSGLVPAEVLDSEYELVQQAFFTEPEDQSGWMYHSWLLGKSYARWAAAQGSAIEEAEQAALLATIDREEGVCKELLEVEPGAKWPLLTLARLAELRQRVTQASGADVAGSASDGAGGGPPLEGQALYAQLGELDPMRAGYYREAADTWARALTRRAAEQGVGPGLH